MLALALVLLATLGIQVVSPSGALATDAAATSIALVGHDPGSPDTYGGMYDWGTVVDYTAVVSSGGSAVEGAAVRLMDLRTRTALAQGTTDATGSVAFAITARGPAVLCVEFDGDTTHAAASSNQLELDGRAIVQAHVEAPARQQYGRGYLTAWISTSSPDARSAISSLTPTIQRDTGAGWQDWSTFGTTDSSVGEHLLFSAVQSAGYRVVLRADDMVQGAVSATRSVVVLRGTWIHNAASVMSTSYRGTARLRSRLGWANSFLPAADEPMQLFASTMGGPWHKVDRGMTGPYGRVVFTVSPRFNTRYRVVHPESAGTVTATASHGQVMSVGAGCHLAVHVDRSGRLGKPISFWGRVLPAVQGRTVEVFDHWGGSTKATTDSTGHFSGTFTIPVSGRTSVWIGVGHDAHNNGSPAIQRYVVVS